MTDTELVTKVLAACGRKTKCKRIGGCLHDIGIDKCCCDDGTCDGQTNEYPPILTSLDACHEVFEKDAPDEYWDEIETMTCDQTAYAIGEWDNLQMATAMCKATPRQRCEAFVKWKNL